MTVVPFRLRRLPEPSAPARPTAAVDPSAPPLLDVRLRKGDRWRRFWIRWLAREDCWSAQVFYGPTEQHRGYLMHDRADVDRAYAQFTRERRESLADGWIETDRPWPRTRRGG